jgi:hypothetical protein
MNRSLLKLGSLGAGCYVASLIASFLLTAILAAQTESWGAARAEKVVLLLFAGIGALFLLSAAVVALGAWRWLPRWSLRLVVVGGYLALIVPTALVAGFLLAVVFNR